jgi:hypothetical protein
MRGVESPGSLIRLVAEVTDHCEAKVVVVGVGGHLHSVNQGCITEKSQSFNGFIGPENQTAARISCSPVELQMELLR